MKGDHDVLVPWSKILYYLRLVGPENEFENVMKGDHDVLKPHEGIPRCFGTMAQNIILPQIGLAQEMDLETL